MPGFDSQRPYVLTNLDVDETATADITRPCTLKGIIASNKNAATLYLKLYNKASAATVGTDTPLLTIGIGVTGTIQSGIINFPDGIAFSAGISLGATTAAAVADTGAPGASDLLVTLLYE